MNGADRLGRWSDVVADTEAIANDYRERDWTAIAVRPGDVNVVIGERRVDVLLSGPAFDEAYSMTADADIDTVRVHAATEGNVRYRLVIAEDADASVAVCVPTFLSRADLVQLRGTADGKPITVRLRPLDDRDVVDITLCDPALFVSPDRDR